MLKKALKLPYLIAALIIFLLMLFVGVFGAGFTWGESLLLSAVITVVGVGSLWLKEFWPF